MFIAFIFGTISQLQGSISGTTLTVTGSGALTQDFYIQTGNYQQYTVVDLQDGVTSIENYALTKSSSLQTIKIPSTLTKIQTIAFRYCPKLEKFIVNDQNAFFRTDSQGMLFSYNLTVLYFSPAQIRTPIIPTSVKYIINDCFQNSYASKINIPWSVVSIGTWLTTESSVTALTFDSNISITNLITSFCWSKIKSFEIPASVESIDKSFQNAKQATKITFAQGSKLKYISSLSFENCPVESLEFPEGLEELQSKSLSMMTNLQCIKLPTTLKTIPSDVFASTTTVSTIDCQDNAYYEVVDNVLYDKAHTVMLLCSTKATKVDISKDMTDISTTLFQGCQELTVLNVADDHTQYYGNNGVLYTKNHSIALSVIGGLTSVEFISDCTILGPSCCIGCKSLQSVTLPNGLLTIGDYSFSRSGIKSIAIPSSLKSMGSNAFEYAENLVSFTFEDDCSFTTFDKNTFFKSNKLLKIRIPKLVTNLVSRSFYYTDSLEELEFEEGSKIRYIEKEAFEGCLLKKIIFPSTLETIGSRSFYSNNPLALIEFGSDSKLYSIGSEAFQDCNISKLELPPLLSDLQTTAFKNNYYLQEVHFLGNKIISLANSIFENDNRLSKMILPSSLEIVNPLTLTGCPISDISFNDPSQAKFTIIEHLIYSADNLSLVFCPGGVQNADLIEGLQFLMDNAFYNSSKLTNLNFPKSCGVSTIPSRCFFMCTSLKSILLPASINTLKDYAFSGCSKLSSITFADGSSLTTIEINSFEDCASISSISFPQSLNYIGENAFSGCSSLVEVKFADGSKLTTLPKSLFNGCNSLSSFTFPDSIVNVTSGIFVDCPSLRSIYFPGKMVKNIDSKSFFDLPITKVEFNNDILLECINDYAFSNTNLKEIKIPKTNKFGIGIFEGCSSLSDVSFSYIDEKLIEIPSRMFAECSILFMELKNIKSIGTLSFKDCKNLMLKSIPSTVTSLGENAFRGAGVVENLMIHKDMKSIGAGCFLETFIHRVNFCGSHDIGSNLADVFDQVTSVNVPFSFMDENFCGVKVTKILDDDCLFPTIAFTDIQKAHVSAVLLSPLIETCDE